MTIALFSQASKVILKIIQTGVQHYLNYALPVFKLDFKKADEPEIKVLINFGSQEKQKSSRNTSTSALLTSQNLFLHGSQQTDENS